MLLLPRIISTYAYSDVTKLSNNRSRPVWSTQDSAHHNLHAVVQNHVQNPWQLNPHGPSVEAFRTLQQLLEQDAKRPLIFDSGCGTGQSTFAIAAAYPDCWVIGIDQSAQRLARTGARGFPHRSGNAIWIRAELATFWFLAQEAGWTLSRHYLLYPNPWPKASQLRRRWHGHPVFPTMLKLGGVLEMRCNWKVYAEEFAAALTQLRGLDVRVEKLQPDAISSAFEIKYRHSGMQLFQVQADLGS